MYLQANSVEKYYGDRKARVQVLKGISCEIARRIEQLELGSALGGCIIQQLQSASHTVNSNCR